MEEGSTYDAKDLPDVVEIPAADSVQWKGSVDAAKADRPIEGEVVIEFPPPIGDVTVGDWDGPSSRVENSGTYDYDVPSALAGVEIPIRGTHSEPGVECAGTAVVKVKGTSPLLYASLAFTVVSAVGVALAIKVKP